MRYCCMILATAELAVKLVPPDGLFSLQWEHKRLNGSIDLLYSPPSREYLSRPVNPMMNGWQNSMVGELSIDLNHGGSMSIQLNTDVEVYGTEQQPYDRQQASAQDLMFDWGLAKQFSLNKPSTYSMDLEIGGFQEWTITQSLLAGGALVVREPGYTIFSTGLQTALTLPEKNMTLTFRYGIEHLMQPPQRHRSLAIELSRSW